MNSKTINEMTAEQRKVLERRVRRMAASEGLMLVKSRRRDPWADDFGLYVLVGDSAGNRYGRYGGQAAVSDFAKGLGMSLEAVAAQFGV